ncbi:SH3 domain-containing protein [Methylophilus sp. 13]|uniref:SH3 domain-containing protein n=1 Tax=Methylophilus sp. 13 TaxID=2781018 RepID=UPI001E55BBFA|nr:SH3 domain-containing protein [Methylophilus sp. 13]
MAITTLASLATATALSSAIITQNPVALRSAPRDSANQQATLWQGEVVEVRGTRMDYLQVYDYKRERAGYIRADQVRMTKFESAEAPELLSVIRYVHDVSGAETLGIALAAAYIKAAPADEVNGSHGTEVLESIGYFADKLARRASSAATLSKSAATTLSAQLDVAAQYGIKFKSYELANGVQICYDGEAYRQVLAMKATSLQIANAALSLTKPECMDPSLQPIARTQTDMWRLDVLAHVNTTDLPVFLKNRVEMRRAMILSNLAYARSRLQTAPEALKLSGINTAAAALAQQSIRAFASVNKNELPDDDLPLYNDTAILVNTNRLAAQPLSVADKHDHNTLALLTSGGQPGETCVSLTDGQHDLKTPLAAKCTYGLVWENSVSINRERNALVVAVQPMQGWREMWVFRKENHGWVLSVLPPAATSPLLGYIEFAGWVPGGKQMLVARESRGEGKYKHNFEVVNLDALNIERQASDPTILGPFQRWQDPVWKNTTLSVR